MDRKNITSYLSLFYGFFLSVIIYLSITVILPLPKHNPNLTVLLPVFQTDVLPQSHKITAYFLALVQIPSLSILFYLIFEALLRRFTTKIDKFIPWLSVLSVVSLLSFVLYVIYNGFTSFLQYKDIVKLDPLIFNPAFLLTFLLGVSFLVVSFFWLDRLKNSLLVKNILHTFNPFLTLIGIVLIVLTLFDRTMDIKNIFVLRTFQYLHSAVFVAPILDILHGRTILVDSFSQYGILINYLPSIIFKYFIPLSFTNFFYLMMAYGIFYYLVAYLLLQKRFASVLWAFVGLVALFSYHFYPAVYRYIRPQFFPIRYMFDLPFFLLLFIFQDNRRFYVHLPRTTMPRSLDRGSIKNREAKFPNALTVKSWVRGLLLSFYIAIAVLYNYETGTSLVLAYLGYICLQGITIRGIKNIMMRFGFIAVYIVTLIASILFIFLAYSLFAKVKTGVFPDWSMSLFYFQLFSSGYLASDGPVVSFYLFPLTIYLIYICRLYLALLTKIYWRNLCWDTSLAIYGICIFFYYVERSFVVNLVVLSIPAIILALLWFRESLPRTTMPRSLDRGSIKNRGAKVPNAPTVRSWVRGLLQIARTKKLAFFGPYIILGGFLLFGFTFYLFRFSKNKSYDYWQDGRDISERLYNQVLLSSEIVNKYLPGSQKIPLISYFDVFISLEAGKVNSLPYTTVLNVMTTPQLTEILNEIETTKPRYLFVDKDEWLKNTMYFSIYDYIYQNYKLVDTAGLINVWERIR